MKNFAKLLFTSLVLLNAACGAADLTQAPGEPVPIVRFRAEPGSFSYYSGFDQPERLVVRDSLTWQTVWNQLYRGQSPTPELPAIDFAHEMIILTALGARSTGGYSILIDGARAVADNTVDIDVRSVSPGQCIVTEAFTQPVDIARMPRSTATVRFIEHTAISNCN